MRKTSSEINKAYKLRKRQFARASKLCITCFRESPNRGRSVCTSCSAKASSRTIRRRLRLRKYRAFQKIILAHEAAGDSERERDLYDNAARHNPAALSVSEIA